MRNDPDTSETLKKLSEAFAFAEELRRNGRLKEVEGFLGQLIAVMPNSAELHFMLGEVRNDQHRTTEAVKLFKHAVKLNPNFSAAYNKLGKILQPGCDYLALLERFHAHLKPSTYIEIGIRHGDSLRLARASAILAVDPEPQIRHELSAAVRIFKETSDEFFAHHDLLVELAGKTVDMAFIDGLHHFDQALKDLINLERFAGKNSVFLIHDCYPVDEASSSREMSTSFWSGDVWKIVPCLRELRPDLLVFTIPTVPAGLCVVANLNPASTILGAQFDEIVKRFIGMQYSVLDEGRAEWLNICPNDWNEISCRLPSRDRR